MQFEIGSAKTRPGVTSIYTLPGNPTLNYLKTYENLQETPRFMSLDSLGVLRRDINPGGALQIISAQIIPGVFGKSDTLFGREFIGFGAASSPSILVTYTLVATQVGSTMFYVLNSNSLGFPLTSSFNIPVNPTPDAVDPGVEFKITSPTALLINGSPSSDFLAFFSVFGGGALGAFQNPSTPDYSLSGPILYSGSESAPTMLPGTFTLQQFETNTSVAGNLFAGSDSPRQYDDSNLFRVSPGGPGAAPMAVDDNTTVIIDSASGSASQLAAATITAISQVGNVVTVVTATPFGYGFVGESIVVAGVTNASYDGTFPVATVISPTSFTYILTTAANLAASSGGTTATQVAKLETDLAIPNIGAVPTEIVGASIVVAGVATGYNGTWPIIAVGHWHIAPIRVSVFVTTTSTALSNAGGGSFTYVGNIPAGVHQVTVFFVGPYGYWTKPAPPVSYIASGGKRALLSDIATGPTDGSVIARIVSFTAAAGQSFYHLGPTGLTLPSSNMYIADNTTTTLAVDFTDAQLLLGTLDDPLFNLVQLPPVAGIIGYSSRLFAWGPQANNPEFLNMGFDGGFSAGTVPLGWTPDQTFGAGGASALASSLVPLIGDAYAITGDGATARRGLITQPADFDYLKNPIILPGIAYGVRARVALAGVTPTAGQAFIGLQGEPDGLFVDFSELTDNFQAFSGTLTAGMVNPGGTLLEIAAINTPTNGSVFLLDEIEIYPLNQQFNNSRVMASFASDEESFDGVTGAIDVSVNDGQGIRSMFEIRERLYPVKEHSFYVTEDDSVQEPAFWPVKNVSKKVGTPSPNGVGIGEDWVIIAHRTGLYIYSGGEPAKISQEIQQLWDTINWDFGYTISVTVDTKERRMMICAPFGSSQVPNATLVMDYHDVGGESEIVAGPPVRLTYTGKKTAFDKSRKWCPWTIPANSLAQIELASGETAIYFGSNDGTGNINELDSTDTIFTDNGANIPSYYTFAAWVEQAMEDGLKLGSHRKLFNYLTMFAQGLGTLGITVYPDSLQNAIALNPFSLTNPAFNDLEMMLNQSRERLFLKVSSSGPGQWFDQQICTMSVKIDPIAQVRGY